MSRSCLIMRAKSLSRAVYGVSSSVMSHARMREVRKARRVATEGGCSLWEMAEFGVLTG